MKPPKPSIDLNFENKIMSTWLNTKNHQTDPGFISSIIV